MKQRWLVLVTTLLALFFISLLTARPAFACGCGHIPTEEEGFAKAEIVFIGKVTRAGSNKPPSARSSSEDYSSALEVQLVLKGQVGPTVTMLSMASCTYPFEQGGTYRVYAYGTPSGDLQTTICDPTTRVLPLWAQRLLEIAGYALIPAVVLFLLFNRWQGKRAEGLT